MRSQEKKQIWLLDDLTDKAIQQRLSMLSAMLSEFRVRLRISVQHLSELMDVHKSCFSSDSPRPDSKVSSTVKYLFAMLELNGMHLHTESLLDLIRQCRNERKELIIRIVDADKPLGKDEYMLLRQKKNYTPPPEEPEKPKRKKRV